MGQQWASRYTAGGPEEAQARPSLGTCECVRVWGVLEASGRPVHKAQGTHSPQEQQTKHWVW